METAQRLEVEAILGKTIGCNDFYLEQGRLDGAIRLTDEIDKLSWLNSLYDLGIRNIEMETPMFAGLLNYWGFSRFGAICTVLLNRLNGDQVSATQEELGQYVENAEKVLLGCLDELI